MTSNWYAAFTRFACEKKVAAQLTYHDLTCYLPLNCIIHVGDDREKLTYRPLFPSCVFVKTTEKDLSQVKKIDDVISLLYWLSKPAVIKNEDIATIKEFLSEYVNVRVKRLDVREFELMHEVDSSQPYNREDIISGDKHQVLLSSIGYIMMAEVNATDVKMIKQFRVLEAN